MVRNKGGIKNHLVCRKAHEVVFYSQVVILSGAKNDKVLQTRLLGFVIHIGELLNFFQTMRGLDAAHGSRT